jgi:hypothetical protein
MFYSIDRCIFAGMPGISEGHQVIFLRFWFSFSMTAMIMISDLQMLAL